MGLAILEQLSGFRTCEEDPFLPIISGQGGMELLPHQEAVIAQAAALIKNIPGQTLE